MKMYEEALLADYCLISEAPYWVALGRLPEPAFEGSRETEEDARRSTERIDDDNLFFVFDGFEEAEFSALGIEVDFERYYDARFAYPGGSGAEYMRIEIESYEQRFGGRMGDELLRLKEEQAREIDWAREVEFPLEPIMDVARASVFKALSAGELVATGWVKFETGSIDKPELQSLLQSELGQFIEIPKEHWTFRRIDWSRCELTTINRRYLIVQVRLADLIERFPLPSIEPVEVNGRFYGTTLILERGDVTVDRGRTKGRPAKKIMSVERVIANVFADKLRRGELPDKKEAVIQESIDWASAMLDQPISRSAAQRYLVSVLGSMPKNDAQN